MRSMHRAETIEQCITVLLIFCRILQIVIIAQIMSIEKNEKNGSTYAILRHRKLLHMTAFACSAFTVSKIGYLLSLLMNNELPV